MTSQSSTIDEAEVARFSALAETWWDPRGKMAVLHKFHPVRLAYIRDALVRLPRRQELRPKDRSPRRERRRWKRPSGSGRLLPIPLRGASTVESNTREATILGLVGAGGIGLRLSERIQINAWDQVAYVIVLILISVAVIDTVSRYLRLRLIGVAGR